MPVIPPSPTSSPVQPHLAFYTGSKRGNPPCVCHSYPSPYFRFEFCVPLVRRKTWSLASHRQLRDSSEGEAKSSLATSPPSQATRTSPSHDSLHRELSVLSHIWAFVSYFLFLERPPPHLTTLPFHTPPGCNSFPAELCPLNS